MPDSTPTVRRGHVQYPNIIADLVKPLLDPAERDCMDYIVRRTYGFTDGHGGRKTRDTIALKQFEHGQSIGNHIRDFGTGLSLNSIKRALAGLEEKQLVQVRWACTHCDWEQDEDDGTPKADGGKTPQCPRCKRTLSRSWAVTDLTPKGLIDFLNAHDRKHRRWEWDPAVSLPRFEETAEQKQTRAQNEELLRDEAMRLYHLLWYPAMVEQALRMAEGQLKAGRKITMHSRVHHFYAPVVELQERFNPALVKYALEQTLNGPVLKQPRAAKWTRYMEAVCKNNERRFSGQAGPVPGSNGAKGSRPRVDADREAVEELLSRTRSLNKGGEFDAARELLSEILGHVSSLAPLFDGDVQACDRSLREAFKQGKEQFLAIKPNPYAPVDYYPEWSWTENQKESALGTAEIVAG